MQPLDDRALLRQFAENQSDEAFAALVARHVNLVYSVALRQVGNPHHADEIAQAVFIILARKAGQLRHESALSSWLFQTTRLTACNFLRRESRRQHREQEAYMESTLNSPAAAAWPHIAAWLDPAVEALGEKDRRAIVLRFYEGRSLHDVGLMLGASEAAAEKRVSRAVEKLRVFFARRGVALTATAIAGAVSVNSVSAAPAGLAQTVAAVAVAKGAAAGTSTLTLVKGALKIMAWTKVKMAVAAAAVVLLVAGTTTIASRKIEQYKADETWRVRPFDSRVLDRLSPQLEILPAKSARSGGYGTSNDKRMGTGVEAETIVQMAFEFWSPARTIVSTELPKDRYDFVASLPDGNAKALQEEIRRQFGVVARRETIETNVLFLTVEIPDAQGLKPSTSQNGSMEMNRPGRFTCVNQSAYAVAGMLEGTLQIPVIDKTGLTQNFDIDLKWNRKDPQHDSLKQAVLDQLGLKLVPARAPVEMLVIEKAEN